MCKKTIVLFCVFLMLLTAFAACKKQSPYGVLVVDQQGMEHVIMTDANGVTVIDSDGNLVEIMTDSSNKKPIDAPTADGTVHADQKGEYETHAVTFPGIVEDGETVENADCKLTVPDGWEQIGNNIVILRHKATDARVMLHTNIGGTATGAIDQLNSDIAQLSLEGDFSQKDVVIDGLTVTRTQYDIGNMTQIVFLLVTEGGKVCRINCSVETDKFDEANIDALVEEIHFK